MIKAIFFDEGDVIINNPFSKVLVEIAKNLDVAYEDVDKINKEYKNKILIGLVSVKDFCQIIKDRLNLSFSVAQIYDIWGKSYQTIRNINRQLYDEAIKLKERYVIGMISNIYDLPAKIDRERGIFNIFDPCILSCEVGLQKPGKEIFELALKRVKLKADECVFIDNRAELLVAPKELGFHVILFENNAKTLEALNDLGVQT